MYSELNCFSRNNVSVNLKFSKRPCFLIIVKHFVNLIVSSRLSDLLVVSARCGKPLDNRAFHCCILKQSEHLNLGHVAYNLGSAYRLLLLDLKFNDILDWVDLLVLTLIDRLKLKLLKGLVK